MFAIAALGLVVAGIVLRVMMKISASRRQRTTIDRHDFDRIDDQLGHELHEDQFAHQRDALSEYLKRSKIPAASDSKHRRPRWVGNDRAVTTDAGESVSHITNKISIREHQRIDVDPREPEWSDDQLQHESGGIDPPGPNSTDDRHQDERRNDLRQHGSVSEADEFLHGLRSSLIAAANEYRFRPSPPQADDGRSNDGHGKDGPSQNGDEIREGEEALERLRRDLDRLLQSPKVA